MRKVWSSLLVVVLGFGLALSQADAKRIGGGRSVGKQSQNVTQREAAPREAPPAGAAAQSAQAPSAAAAPRTAVPGQPAQPSGARRWLGPLAGIAAGLGLAALAHSLGFGEGLASLMLVMLVVFAGIVVLRMVMARRASGPAAARPFGSAGTNLAYSGVGQEASVPGYSPIPPSPREPEVVRPRAFAGGGGRGGSVPAGFDVDGFLRQAKAQYVRMQAAFDAADIGVLKEFTSAEMFAQLRLDIGERRDAVNRTDVVTLEAELLGIEDDAFEHTASVRFHGMVREQAGAPAEPFDEVWNLTKPLDGSQGWVLAGVQQLG
jgi:predicted lipid-binding transport protein (Tim44 family)